MRRADEFATWLAARWPALVRTSVFLGHPQPRAEALARAALVQVVPRWEGERREGDVDVLVYAALVEEHERALRRPDAAGGDAPVAEPEPPTGPADRTERRRELERHLAALPAEQRTRAVLVHVSGLSVADVDDVTGGPTVGTADGGTVPVLPMSVADVRDACEAVPMTPAPVAEVLERSRHRRRTRWRRTAAVVAVVVALVLATSWWTSGDDEAPGQHPVTRAANPLPIAWYADDTLHLAQVEVAVPGVDALLGVPDGVVYADRDGRVVHVDEAGRERTLGQTVPGSRMAVERDNGWVAWADPGGGVPELVVYDTLGREQVGRRPLSPAGTSSGQPVGDGGPIAIDDERVFYRSPTGDFAWEPLIDLSFALSGTMLDTAEEARVTLSDDVLRLTPLAYRTGTPVTGTDATLTDDGRYAFVRDGQDFLDGVYRVETAEAVTPYSPSDEAVSWAYQDGTFYFALLHRLQDKTYQDMLQMPSEGAYRIYACRAGGPGGVQDRCTKLTEVPEEVPDPPLFAR